MSRVIDINCDMGEGFGAYAIGGDDALVAWVSSANIACGFHAGDPSVMRRTVKSCLAAGVAIGAHPGLPDRQGFGRRSMALTAEEVFEIVVYQIGALQAIARAEGGSMGHVKPHGALYHMAETDRNVSEAIVRAVASASPDAALVGFSQGRLVAAGEAAGLRVRHEAFADRTYRRDGTLTPRTEPGAVIAAAAAAAAQALDLATNGRVRTAEGEWIPIRADTICLHGDAREAPAFAEAIHRALAERGIHIGGGDRR
ncbi:LamB/YcsF family protein [Paenibacillus sp. TRM 82003]|nr:LamB/YcsF family protein [Paenibacillus sp. TRM 82003]